MTHAVDPVDETAGSVLGELRARWPDTPWTEARIAGYLASLADQGALAGDHRGDLLWVWACIEGDAAAIDALEIEPLRAARAHLASLGFAADAIDEAMQRARHRLLVDGALRGYRGRGPLTAYVRTAVVRLAIDDQRRTGRDVELGDLLAGPTADPELEYMRKLYAEHLVAAVRDAWQRLAPHEQFVLSLRIYEGMSIDDIARVYQSHRASAARRAAAARASLIAHTRAALRERLSVGETTLDSILRIVTSSVQLPLDKPIGR